jgi:TonB family protein
MRTQGRRPAHNAVAGVVACVALTCATTACVTKDDAKKLVEALDQGRSARPDELPVMRNATLPFVYPPALYAEKAQGNVTLRIFIDSVGHVHPESTHVAQTSGRPPFDSAAVAGARALEFVPAKRKGVAMSVSILFPVYFRHPQAPPLAGDSTLHRTPTP